MKRIALFTILLWLIILMANSQEIKFGFSVGYGQYSMGDLKKINEYLPKNFSFDSKVVSNFPSYLYFQPSFLVKINKTGIGILYIMNSTGSRISAKDYSGEYFFDMNIRGNSFGIISDYTFIEKNNFCFLAFSMFGITSSQLNINEHLDVFDSLLVNGNYDYKSINLFLNPGLELSYTVKNFKIGFDVGYNYNFSTQDFYLGNDKENKLYIPSFSKALKPDWNGYRFSFSLYYFIKKE